MGCGCKKTKVEEPQPTPEPIKPIEDGKDEETGNTTNN